MWRKEERKEILERRKRDRKILSWRWWCFKKERKREGAKDVNNMIFGSWIRKSGSGSGEQVTIVFFFVMFNCPSSSLFSLKFEISKERRWSWRFFYSSLLFKGAASQKKRLANDSVLSFSNLLSFNFILSPSVAIIVFLGRMCNKLLGLWFKWETGEKREEREGRRERRKKREKKKI